MRVWTVIVCLCVASFSLCGNVKDENKGDKESMSFTAYIARAFCHGALGGNPAGVVIVDQEHPFTTAQMQSIATELNFSETVFISSTEPHSYKALYFTPTSPIDFCGHATLAAFGVLKQLGLAEDSVYPLDTQAGKCEVTLKDHLIFLSQPLPVFGEEIVESEITPILGDFVSAGELPPRIVSTGLRDIFVQLQDEKCLQSLKPNLTRMSELNKRTDSIGMHVFSLDPSGSSAIAHCRNFAPLHGIDEESATGSSNGALACYLFEKGLLPPGSEHQLLFRQGDSLNAPSDIYVHLKTREGKIEKVECGGEVVVDQKRELAMPNELSEVCLGLSFKEFEQQGWERVADVYHECFGQITPKAGLALVNSAMIKQNDKVLDVACGPGYVAAIASEKGGVVTGIDFSSAMIQRAKTLHPEINFQVMDAEELQFSDGVFDVVLMNFGILHLAKPEQAIAEAFRVLKPGGKFLFTVWDTPVRSKAFDFIMSALKEDGDLNLSLPEGPDFFKFSDPSTSNEILSNTGFNTIEASSIEFTWTLSSAQKLFQAFYKGGIRIGGILRAQKPEAIRKIIKKLEQKTKPFQKKGRLEIPISVMFFKAEKV